MKKKISMMMIFKFNSIFVSKKKKKKKLQVHYKLVWRWSMINVYFGTYLFIYIPRFHMQIIKMHSKHDQRKFIQA